MTRRIAWRPRALAELETIDTRNPTMARRIRDAVAVSVDDEHGDVQKLSGGRDLYRLRVGDWRVLFTIESHGQLKAILRVLNRRDAYR